MTLQSRLRTERDECREIAAKLTDEMTARELLAFAQLVDEAAERLDADLTLLRDIGQYCEDHRLDMTALASMPPQNSVAVHVHNTVLRYLNAYEAKEKP